MTITADPETLWTARARTALVGCRIAGVRYVTDAEAAKSGWRCRPLAIALDTGAFLFAASDDEGNDGGALYTTIDRLPVIPTLARALHPHRADGPSAA